MRQLDARALENIATAPASASDRYWATAACAGLAGLFVLAFPFGHMQLDRVDAFLPTIVGASVVALSLTAVLLYVQYRIERDTKLALLAIAYGYGAISLSFYILTFPHTFSEHGLFGAGSQTAAYWYGATQAGFAALVIAQGFAARARVHLRRDQVRLLALATAAALAAMATLFGPGHELLPHFVSGDGAFSLLWARLLAPLLAIAMVAGAVVVGGRFKTVSQIWLAIVLLTRALDVFTATDLGGSRFSFDWYLARLDTLIGAFAMLAVFLVKINDLMLRLAARNRSTAEALEVGAARYASLANVVPQLIWTTDATGRVEYVNDRWVAYTGLDLNATRDGEWRQVLDADHAAGARESWQQSLRSGEAFAAEVRVRGVAHERGRWFLVNAVPARDSEGAIVAWIGTCTDVDAQKGLEERETFLARAGQRLVASLDVVDTVGGMKALLIPRLADRFWVALLDDDGRFVVRGVGSAEGAVERAARRAVGVPLAPPLHDAVAAAVAAGDAAIVDDLARFPDPWLSEGPAATAMIVPLISAQTSIGVLAMARYGRAFEDDDVDLIREFARRAALSLEHARLYERERATADALQRAMLPAHLPLLPDLRFSASYSAASESQRVGGDFYDAFVLPDGRVALTIGDVTGHGLEAAVIMGEIRQALRASAFEAAEPSTILDRANRLLIASGRSVFVTAIFGILDPATGHFSYASAGHPAPLVADEAGLRRLPTAGLPIGLRDEEGVDFGMRLHAPCTLVLFTDGLMEFARDLDEGERRIEAAIRSFAHDDVDQLAAALMQRVLGKDIPTDDIAILTLSIARFSAARPGDEREWSFSSSDASTAAMVRRAVGASIVEWTGRPDAGLPGELTFGELIANAVRHAPGTVRVLLSRDELGNTLLEVEDSGTGFRVGTCVAEPLAESGRGLELVRYLADDVRVESASHGGSRVVAEFRAADAGGETLAISASA